MRSPKTTAGKGEWRLSSVTLEYYEIMTLAMFEEQTRSATIQNMQECLPYIKQDQELTAIVESTIRKAERLTEEEFLKLHLERYRQEVETE